MANISLKCSTESAAARARVLKGSIFYLLEELIDTCTEEGMDCGGLLRKQLSRQIDELACFFRTYPTETGVLLEDIEVLERVIEALEGPEVRVPQLRTIQPIFLRLLHPAAGE
jgi:hypothetical protein